MEIKNRNTYYFYESEDIIYYIKEGTKKLLQMTRVEKSKMDDHFFELNENYEGSLEGIKSYEKEFNRCNEEIKNLNIENIDTDFNSSRAAVR